MALRAWTIVGCVLGLSCGAADEPAPPCEGRITEWRDAVTIAPSGLEAECLVIGAGSVVTIAWAETTVVRARTVVIEGEATVDGSPRDTPREVPTWTSGGANCAYAHANWDAAARGRGRDDVGAPGFVGGSFVLRYGRIVGGAERLARLTFDVAGTPGAPGRELRCGCAGEIHATHVARGADGTPGAPGTWRFIEEPP